MTDDQKRAWDVGLGIAAPLLTIAGILVGVWSFTEGENNRTRFEYELLARQSAVDFQRQLWKEQLKTYKEISRLAGQIAAHNGNASQFRKMVDQFRALYWGAAILIEDKPVEEKLIEFNAEIQDFLAGRTSENRLKGRALRLVKTCRESSERQWKKISGSIQTD